MPRTRRYARILRNSMPQDRAERLPRRHDRVTRPRNWQEHFCIAARGRGSRLCVAAVRRPPRMTQPFQHERDKPWIFRTYAGHSTAAKSNARRNGPRCTGTLAAMTTPRFIAVLRGPFQLPRMVISPTSVGGLAFPRCAVAHRWSMRMTARECNILRILRGQGTPPRRDRCPTWKIHSEPRPAPSPADNDNFEPSLCTTGQRGKSWPGRVQTSRSWALFFSSHVVSGPSSSKLHAESECPRMDTTVAQT